MEADRPVKRQRSDEENATPVQRSDIWFDDGNIVLQAENVQFRVHRSLLARHSPVFQDVFGVPQPETTSETLIEECPVVHLTDKATDVKFMLTRLFGLASLESLRKAPTISDLISSLRMGHKYLIVHLWDDCVACLRRAFPKDLKKMQEAMTKDSRLIAQGEDATSIRLTDGDHILHLVDVLVAVGLETVLPALYYRILWSTSVETIMADDGVSDRARVVLLGGRAKLLEMTNTHMKPWTKHQSWNCNCREERSQFYLSAIDGMLPLGTWSQPATVCVRCRESYLRFVGIMRLRVHDQLPKIFNLPFWRELRDFDISGGLQSVSVQ